MLWKNVKTNLRNKLFAGILTLIPVVITVLVIRAIITFFDNIVSPIIDPRIGFHIPGLGLIVSLILIYLLGLLITNVLGRSLFGLFEKWLNFIPLVRTVYQTTKQIMSAFSLSKTDFQRVVYVEYPRKGIWTLGFVTGTAVGKDGSKFFTLFLPTTPNPTSGWALFVREDEVISSDMTIEEGLKAIISAGSIIPPQINLVKGATE
jgi:uncharacterized membrane protein